jgi:trans-2,3-dihydro-3-hydroxyanthranilate isomerase
MAEFRFDWVDVFTSTRFGGNPLAVFADAREIPELRLQQLARELNLSETTFVYPAQDAGDARVRIFTPAHELPFAGHPTLGTAFVLARLTEHPAQGKSHLVLELNVGPIEVEVEGDAGGGQARMRSPAPEFLDRIADPAAAAMMAEALGLSPHDLVSNESPIQTISCGVPWTFVPQRNLEVLGAISINPGAFRHTAQATGCRFWYPFVWMGGGAAGEVRSRAFAPLDGVAEDPATGSAAGPMLAYLLHHGLVNAPQARLLIEQGVEMGRPSQLEVEAAWDGERVRNLTVGGHVLPVLSGTMRI